MSRLSPSEGNHVLFLSQLYPAGAICHYSSDHGVGTPQDQARTVDLFDVFCGVLYVLKSGGQWRMLPKDFPDWRTRYKYFRHWSEKPDPEGNSILEEVLKKVGWRGPTKQWSQRAN